MIPSDASSNPGQRIDREYLYRRREAEIAAHFESGRRALDEQDADEAQRALDDAMMLDPDDSRVVALQDRLVATRAHPKEAGVGDRGHPTDWLTRWPIASGIAVVGLLVSMVVLWQIGSFDWGSRGARGRLLASAQESMDAGRYEEAVARFSELLSSDREDTRAAAGLATSTRALEAEGQRAVDAVSAQAGGRLDPPRPLSDGRSESDPGHTPPAARLGPTRIAGVELRSSDRPPRAADAPSTLESRPVRPSRGTTPVSRSAQAALGPTIDVSLCGNETACGVVTVKVRPTADILFNGVMIGTAAQGVLRLPTGRHRVSLQSDAYQFRRMVRVEAGSPASLDINLEDDGLPRGRR